MGLGILVISKMTDGNSETYGGMLGGIARGLRLMTRKELRVAILLMVTSLVDGFLQTVVIVAIVPIVQLIVDPSSGPVGWLFTFLRPFLRVNDSQASLIGVAFALMVLVIIKAVFGWFQTGWMARFSASCEIRLSKYLMELILKAPYVWLVRQNSARLRQLLFGYVAVWSRDFMRTLMKLVNDLSFVFFIIAVLIASQPLAGLIVIVTAIILGLVIFRFIRPRLQHYAETKRRGVLGANRISTEAVLGFKEVKMAGAEDRFAQLFDEQVKIYAGTDSKAQQWVQLPRYLLEVVAYCTLIGLSIGLVLFDNRSPEAAGVVLLYGLAAVRLLPLFSTVISGFATLIGSFPLIFELEQLTHAAALPERSSDLGATASKWHEFNLDKVTVKYQEDRLALEGISLSIKPGMSYGIVGQSGAGKSTVIDVIAGLLPPTSGKVMLNGTVLSGDQQIQWRRHFGYVAQRPFLLDASLRDNIVFNTEVGIDKERLREVITLARLDKVVERLPGGLDGALGEQGVFLSGGERQRVAIARALYRGADLLILDEATSSLDTIVEQEIAESLHTLHRKVTTIIVSHRMRLIRNCDEIWLFDNACLKMRGTHEQLLESSELYRRMTAQSDEARAQ
jgi:ABC-type bacteriocin/lantibiotic exporter with double-glycine peptidase domain